MIRSAPFVWLFPAVAAAVALALFAIAGWNAVRAGALTGLVETAVTAQPVWFCH
jgi:hypothetical protein